MAVATMLTRNHGRVHGSPGAHVLAECSMMNADPARLTTANRVKAVLNCDPTVAIGASQNGDNPALVKRIGRAQHAARAKADAIPMAISTIALLDLISLFMSGA